jgi:hypothetical protein
MKKVKEAQSLISAAAAGLSNVAITCTNSLIEDYETFVSSVCAGIGGDEHVQTMRLEK